MADVPTSGHDEAKRCAGSGGRLALAAAPTFALMALWTGTHGAPSGMAMPSPSPLSGMTMMYLLMFAFHLSPWLQAIARRRRRAGPAHALLPDVPSLF